MTKISSIIDVLENVAPRSLQESYDNAGLIIGDKNADVTGVLVCLDSIEEVLDEAIDLKCNLIVAHHPIVFGGLKRINGSNYIERTVIKAIKNDIAIYAIHTNLDNVIDGVNKKISDKLGLVNTRILRPKADMLSKLVTFVPKQDADKVRNAMFTAGAGAIGNYSECSFNTDGQGTFKGGDGTDPHIGESGKRETVDEVRIEVLVEKHITTSVLSALFSAHPYEEVAYDVYPLSNMDQEIGSGMIGELHKEMSELDFLGHVKSTMECDVIRHTELLGQPVVKVALCGGSGSFLLEDAKRAGAQVFISADFKYHQFFDADGKILVADIGHFESEHFTVELLSNLLVEKFPNFGVHLTGHNTNPIKYL